MTLAHRSLAVATCIGALVVCVWTGCKRDHVDRDGFTERTFDKGATDKSGAGTTTVTGADMNAISSDTAVDRVVGARCTRETSCNNIGSDKHYASYEACSRELRSKIGGDLEPSKCPRGIDVNAVNRCMEAIRNESCNDPADTISRLAACKTSSMCIAE